MKLYYKWIFLLFLFLLQACSDEKQMLVEETNITKEAEEKLSDELTEQISTHIYKIDDKKYYIESLPKEYAKTLGKERFYFLKKYINYQIVLESLTQEQKKYSKKIENNRRKVFDLVAKKGNNISALDRTLLFKKIAIDTIIVELLRKKDTNINKKVQTFYDKNRDFYDYPDTVEISAITLKEKEELEAVVDKLKKGNINIKRFSSFSSRYSSSPKLKRDGGYIGKLSAKSAKPKFFQILWDSNITKGFLDKIIYLDDFYTVVYIHGKEKAFTQNLEKERDNIEQYLFTSQKEQWIKKRIHKIMNKKEVEIYDDFKDQNISQQFTST